MTRGIPFPVGGRLAFHRRVGGVRVAARRGAARRSATFGSGFQVCRPRRRRSAPSDGESRDGCRQRRGGARGRVAERGRPAGFGSRLAGVWEASAAAGPRRESRLSSAVSAPRAASSRWPRSDGLCMAPDWTAKANWRRDRRHLPRNRLQPPRWLSRYLLYM